MSPNTVEVRPIADIDQPDTGIRPSELLQELDDHLRRVGISARPSATENEIDAAEAELPCELPPLLPDVPLA
jgi:hypothetical protein